MAVVRHKEAIHSGHFMISEFEADAEDEEDLNVPPTEEGSNLPLPQLIRVEEESEELGTSVGSGTSGVIGQDQGCRGGAKDGAKGGRATAEPPEPPQVIVTTGHNSQTIIDLSLNKLFRSMSIAYRQRLTSPKWNRFRGMKMRWKDKIRLNNVIWRCWHMQFIKGRRRLLCAFANPLEIDHHNKTEGGTIVEGKYWKRKLQTITKEYMRWRMFYKNRGNDDGEITDKQWDLIFQSPFQVSEDHGHRRRIELELAGHGGEQR